MSNDDEERILELLRREASHGRQHTSDSSWHDRSAAGKSLVERAWFDSLIVELQADGACPYKLAIASDDEWPDCEATLVGSGGRVAVEVSEVVRGTSLAPEGRPEPWTREQFLEVVQSRITEKDAKFHGGRFAEYMVLLHTDELFLVQEWVEPALQGRLVQLTSRDNRYCVPHPGLSRRPSRVLPPLARRPTAHCKRRAAGGARLNASLGLTTPGPHIHPPALL